MSDKSKLVYICSPYRTGNVDENVRRAREYCRLAVEEGFIPVAPHLLYPQFLDDGDESQREAGISCGLELLSVCAEVWVFDYTDDSNGMLKEIQFSFEKNIPIKIGSITHKGLLDLEPVEPFLTVLWKIQNYNKQKRMCELFSRLV